MQKNLRDPRHHNKNENENVIALQPAPDCFQLADLEAGQNQIFADELFPLALEQVSIFHHHRHEEMRFEHANARPEGVIESITAGPDPKHTPTKPPGEKKKK